MCNHQLLMNSIFVRIYCILVFCVNLLKDQQTNSAHNGLILVNLLTMFPF